MVPVVELVVELDPVVVVPAVESAVESSVSSVLSVVVEFALEVLVLELSAVVSGVSLELVFELLSLGALSEVEECELELTRTLELDEAGAPSLVCVVVFTTTFVALNAKTIETIANGVINGGVRYAIFHISPLIALNTF